MNLFQIVILSVAVFSAGHCAAGEQPPVVWQLDVATLSGECVKVDYTDTTTVADIIKLMRKTLDYGNECECRLFADAKQRDDGEKIIEIIKACQEITRMHFLRRLSKRELEEQYRQSAQQSADSAAAASSHSPGGV